jgi:hypothetical protein
MVLPGRGRENHARQAATGRQGADRATAAPWIRYSNRQTPSRGGGSSHIVA